MAGRWGGSAKCPTCSKSVYANEEVAHEQRKYHKACFKCCECSKGLDSLNVCSREEKLYCKRCYAKNYGIGGYGYGQGAGVLGTDGGGTAKTNAPALARNTEPSAGAAKFGGGNKCGRCGKTVYMAEEVIGAGAKWHKRCFTCENCNKTLDSTTVSDKDGKIYCKGCYGKQFGPKGVGFGIGAGTLTT